MEAAPEAIVASPPAPKRSSLASLRQRIHASASSDAASVVTDAPPLTPTPKKKQSFPQKRKASAGSLGPLMKSPRRTATSAAASSPAGQADARSSTAADSPGPAGLNVSFGQVCLGCARITGVDLSHLSSSQPFAWLKRDGVGLMCRNCGNLYRCWYKGSMSVDLWARWLTSEEHRRIWRRRFLCYLSLKFEGMQHVSLSALDARDRLFSWAFDLAQVPWPASEITPITPDFLHKVAAKEPGFYVLPSADGLAAFGIQPRAIPATQTKKVNCTRFVTMSQAARGWPLLPLRSLPDELTTMWHEHLEEQTSCAGTAMLMGAEAEGADGQDINAAAAASSSSSKVHSKKVATLLSAIKLTIEAFVLDGSTTKEKDFTPLLTKVLKMKQDLIDAAAEPELMDQMTTMGSVINACKALVRPLKEYKKTGKRTTLTPLVKAMHTVATFIQDRKLAFGPYFGTAFMKCCFFDFHSQNCYAALAFMSSFDFSWKILADPSAPQHPANIIHQCILSVVLEALQQPVEETAELWSAHKKTLQAQTQTYIDLVAAKIDTLPTLKSTAETLGNFMIVLKAACGDPLLSPSHVSAAKAAITGDAAAAHLREGLGFRGVGMALNSDSDAMIVKGALDDQHDADYSLHLQTMFTNDMPDLAEDELILKVGYNIASIDPDTNDCQMLAGALEGIIQVLRGWSPCRIAEEIGNLRDIMKHLAHTTISFDGARSIECCAIWRPIYDTWNASPKLILSRTGALDLPEGWADFGIPDETKCMGEFGRISKLFVDTLVQVATFDDSAKAESNIVEEALATWRHNYTLRRRVWTEGHNLCTLAMLDTTNFADMINKFVNCEDTTAIHAALVVAEVRHSCESNPPPVMKKYAISVKCLDPPEDQLDIAPDDMQTFVEQHFIKSAAAQAVVAQVVKPSLALASQAFLQHLVCLRTAALSLPNSRWVDSAIADDPTAFFSNMLNGNTGDATSSLSHLIDGSILDAIAEGSEAIIKNVFASMRIATASNALLRIAAAHNHDNSPIHIPTLVQDDCLVPCAVVCKAAEALAIAETFLATNAWLANFLKTLHTAANKDDSAFDTRYLALAVAFFSKARRLFVTDWAEVKHSTLSLGGVEFINPALELVNTFVQNFAEKWMPLVALALEAYFGALGAIVSGVALKDRLWASFRVGGRRLGASIGPAHRWASRAWFSWGGGAHWLQLFFQFPLFRFVHLLGAPSKPRPSCRVHP